VTNTLHTERGRRFDTFFIDLANETSKGIYLRIGYRPIGDRQLWRFAYDIAGWIPCHFLFVRPTGERLPGSLSRVAKDHYSDMDAVTLSINKPAGSTSLAVEQRRR
jgi:hypothetical protein